MVRHEIQGTLTTLLIRAETTDDSKIVSEQIVLLQENLENLRKLHEQQGEKGLSPQLTGPMRIAFNTQFSAVTDNNWFSYLSRLHPDEINYWQPRSV